MNIIISSLNVDGIKITGNTGSDINFIKVFVSKELSIIPKRIDVSRNTNLDSSGLASTITYPIALIRTEGFDKDDYFAYILTAKTSIPLSTYVINFVYASSLEQIEQEEFVKVGEQEISNLLEDEHEPIFINGRQINPVTTPIVAGDVKSQQLSFYIKKCYDGVSFLDESKQIYIDYIPVDFTPTEDCHFKSDPINEILDDPDPASQMGDWLLLKWNVPAEAMKKAGSVRFGLAVLNKTVEDNKTIDYCWQTFPSSFSVSPNIGLRGFPVAPEESVSAYSEISNRVTDVESFLGYQTDDESNNDKEVVVGGGNASEYIASEEVINND